MSKKPNPNPPANAKRPAPPPPPPRQAPAAPSPKRVKAIKKLTDLTPDAQNPNRGTERGIYAVETSLEKYGAGRSILVDAKGRVIAGNKTLQAAADKGFGVDVVQTTGDRLVVVQRTDLDLDDPTGAARALSVADNRAGQLGLDWDPVAMSALVADGMDVAGFFSEGELAELLAGAAVPKEPAGDPEPQIDKADALAKHWGVKTGQVWRLGEHRLACGDSTDAAVIARVMQGDRPQMVFTDPPYGVAIGKKNRLLNAQNGGNSNERDIEDDALSPADLKARLVPAFTNLRKACADDCTYFVCAPQGGGLGMMMMMMQESCLTVRHVLIWKKNQPTFSMGRLDYDYQHEPILLTWTKKHNYFGKGEHRTSVWEIDKPRKSAEHPTMKPVELVENALLNNSAAGMVVADIYLGSGTTLIACERLGRKCRGVEISPGYVGVIIQRWVDATGGTPELLADTAATPPPAPKPTRKPKCASARPR